MDENFADDHSPLTASSLMRNILNPDYPKYMERLLNQVKGWLTKTFRVDGIDMAYWEVMRENPDALFSELKWIESKVALLPAAEPPQPHAEAVVLYLGEVDIYESMRLAVDYSLIFSKGNCRRIWVITDCWIPSDIMGYKDHIKAMTENGITLRFLIITPWGWIELPLASLGEAPLPPGENGRPRRRRGDEGD